tara:strand:- start:1302 stop:1787 length:486 start_codon:yes stop_codon:yes gene_type:complete
MRGVIDFSALDKAEREAHITALMAEPHQGTIEDLDFAAKHLEMTPQESLAMFATAEVFCGVQHPERDDVMLYMFCVSNGYFSTLLHRDLDRFKVTLTKSLIRYARSPAGQAMGWGKCCWADVDDIAQGYFTNAWAKRIGFEPIDTYDAAGTTFQRYQFQGA